MEVLLFEPLLDGPRICVINDATACNIARLLIHRRGRHFMILICFMQKKGGREGADEEWNFTSGHLPALNTTSRFSTRLQILIAKAKTDNSRYSLVVSDVFEKEIYIVAG